MSKHPFTSPVVAAAMLAFAGFVAWTPKPAVAQDGVVAGTVVDGRTQAPLSGVHVSVDGTQLGALTDGNGRFRIVQTSRTTLTLRARIIGYRTMVRTAEPGQLDVRFELDHTAIDLDEIVVTGTAGGEQRRAVGHSVGRVRPDELLELTPVRDLTELLNARVPGVGMHRAEGHVGSSPAMTIRGRSSLSLSGFPLIYVDGVRINNDVTGLVPETAVAVYNPLDLINAADIESIEIIRGPAAATLYGTEASSGVIQIITKSGTRAEPQIDLRIRQGTNWLLNAGGRFPTNLWRDPATGQVQELNIVQREADRGTPIFRTGHAQGYGLSVGGATDAVRYNASLNYDDDQGTQYDNNSERLTARGRLSIAPHRALDANVSFGLVRGNTQIPVAPRGSNLSNVFYSHPSTMDTPQRGFWQVPQDIARQIWQFHTRSHRNTAGLELQHRPREWFNHRLVVGADIGFEQHDHRANVVDPELQQWVPAGQRAGDRQLTRRDGTVLTVDYAGNLPHALTEDVGSRTSVGIQYYRRSVEESFLRGRDYPGPGMTAIAAAARRDVWEESFENATLGVYAQQQFSWRDRLFVTGAVRVDNNSAFGAELDWVTYPKFSLAWSLSDEPFWNVDAVDVFRLRTAYGASGQQPDYFAAIRTYQPIIGVRDEGGLVPDAVGNPELRPERGEEIELGFEAALFDHRVELDFTFYRAITRDAILLREVPPSSGFYPARQNVNAGEVKNQGFELMVDFRAVQRPRFSWDLALSLARNDNEILRLDEGVDYMEVGWIPNRHQPGYPIASFFMKRAVSADLDASGNPINMMCDGGPGSTGPVACDDAPKVFLGNGDPDWEGSVSSTLTLFRNWRLYTNVDVKLGVHTYDWTEHARCVGRGLCEQIVYWDELSALERADIELARAFQGSYYVEDISFAKLRDISLSYMLPAHRASAFGVSRASVTFSGRNLLTWTPYGGVDPEMSYNVYETSRRNPHYRDSPWTVATVPPHAQFVTSINLTF